MGVNDWLRDNPCWECHCGWWDSDMGCTCPGNEMWYQCPLEPEPDWDKIMREMGEKEEGFHGIQGTGGSAAFPLVE